MPSIEAIPVIKEFHNSDTGGLFTNCMMCSTELNSTHYVIEKAFRNYKELGTREIIFEYAMCINCAAKMHMELSEESRNRISHYMSLHISKKTYTDDGYNEQLSDALSKCCVKSTNLSKSTEYSIYSLCNGDQMVLGEFPYALSGEAQDEIMKLLSAKTLEVMDDFIGRHFSGPPEVMDILRRKPILI